MSRGNPPLMRKTKNAAPPANPQGQMVQVQQNITQFQGPIPPPEILQGYGEIDSNFPDRIVTLAEGHVAADVKTKYRKSWSELITPIIGQVLTFLLGIGGIGACVFLATKGYTAEGIAVIAGSFTPMILNAILGLSHGNKN